MRKLSIVLALVSLTSCKVGDEASAVVTQLAPADQWAFLHFNVPYGNEGKVDSYFFYARVSGELLKQVANMELTQGFIMLNDTIYFSEALQMYLNYADDDSSGQILFRIEDLVQAEIRNKPPEVGVSSLPEHNDADEQQDAMNESSTAPEPEPVAISTRSST